MRKQYGVTFEAPKCTGHGEEMSLSVMGPFEGPGWSKPTTFVEWYCPHDEVEKSCGNRTAELHELPAELQVLLQ